MHRIVPIAFGLAILAPAYAYTTSGNTLTVTNCSNQTDLQNAITAAPSGGTVTFACGTPSSPAAIPITSSIIASGHTFTLEGNGAVILSGSGSPGTVLDLASATVTVRDITITGGTGASVGGGIEVAGSSNPVTVINVTLYNNAATGAAGRGGGIYVLVGTVTVINSTFSGNSATEVGNDIESDESTVNLENSIFLDGCFNNGGTINNVGGNLDTGTSCIASNSNGSLVNVGAPILGALLESLYFPLASGSLAIDFDTANCPSRDELGNPRGSVCSAGAVQDNTPPANIPATPLPGTLWLILAGLAAWGIHSIWPSRMWTTRSP